MAPRATRQTAVFIFSEPMALFVFDERLPVFLSSIFDGSSRFATDATSIRSNTSLMSNRVGWFKAVSCSISTQGEPGSSSFHDVSTIFWLTDERCFSFRIPVPSTWSARMYAALLRVTITQNNLAIFSPDDVLGTEQSTLNTVHWLFDRSVDAVDSDISRDGLYVFVRGGDG
jgi:hypothetical protein